MMQPEDSTRDAPAPSVAELVDRHYGAVFAYLYWLLGDRIAAQDLTQEAFLHAYDLRTQPSHTPDPKPWLFQTATELGRKAGLARAGNAAAQFARDHAAMPAPGEPAFAALPFDEAAALLLCWRCGFSAADAAHATGVTLPQVTAWLAAHQDLERAIARLPEPWPERYAEITLSEALRSGKVSDLRRRAAPEPPASPPRHRIFLRVALMLALASGLGVGLWLLAGRPALAPGPPPTPTAYETPAPPTATPAPTSTPVPTSTPAPGEPGFEDLAWLKRNAIPLTSIEPGTSSTDLVPLKKVIGIKHVAVVDDMAGYGSHEAQAFRQRSLELAAETPGFTTLILQVDWPVGEALDQYIQGGDADPLALLDMVRQRRGPWGETWQSQEMLYTLRWLAAYNSRPGQKEPIHIEGFLPSEQPSSTPSDIIMAYLSRTNDVVGLALAANSPEDVAVHLRSHGLPSLETAAIADYQRALHAATALEQAYKLTHAQTPAIRDQMYRAFAEQNLMWLLENSESDSRSLVWTQSLGSTGLPGAQEFVQFIHEWCMDSTVTLGFTINQGSLYLVGRAEPSPLSAQMIGEEAASLQLPSRFAAYHLAAPSRGSYEEFLAHVDQPYYLLDVRGGFMSDPVTPWLRQPHLARLVTGTISACDPEGPYTQTRLDQTYDILVFIRQVKPAYLLYPATAPQAAACP